MKDFFEWIIDNKNNLPWLIIGKGPSFKKIKDIDISNYQTIALNHAVSNTSCDIFHMIDLDVIIGIEANVDKNARFILMPYYPNVNNQSGSLSINEIIKENTFLKKMDVEGRLLCYNSSQAKKYVEGFPVITVKYFSADAVVSLLIEAGVTTIWSAGLDGGTTYNSSFNHLNDKTLLSNGRSSFNSQFIAIAQALKRNNAHLIPLGKQTIPVYVGTEVNQWLATKVLEFSIKIRTSASVDVLPLYEENIDIPLPKDKINHPRTPFSFQRFLIPELCNYTGKAIYLDSDMQVFTDIRDLYERDIKDHDIMNVWDVGGDNRKPQFSVMLLNCKSLQWKIKEIIRLLDSKQLTYENLMHDMAIAKISENEIEREWNSLEHYEEGKTKLIHYTDMNKQPWLFRNNPNVSVWVEELIDAVKYGFITKKDLYQQVLIGDIRPTLLYQVRRKMSDPTNIPRAICWIDKLFCPPHQQRRLLQKNHINKLIKGTISIGLVRLFS